MCAPSEGHVETEREAFEQLPDVLVEDAALDCERTRDRGRCALGRV